MRQRERTGQGQPWRMWGLCLMVGCLGLAPAWSTEIPNPGGTHPRGADTDGFGSGADTGAAPPGTDLEDTLMGGGLTDPGGAGVPASPPSSNAAPGEVAPQAPVAGDASQDGRLDAMDGVDMVQALQGAAPLDGRVMDTDGDGTVTPEDVSYLFRHLYAGGPQPVGGAPAASGRAPGGDPVSGPGGEDQGEAPGQEPPADGRIPPPAVTSGEDSQPGPPESDGRARGEHEDPGERDHGAPAGFPPAAVRDEPVADAPPDRHGGPAAPAAGVGPLLGLPPRGSLSGPPVVTAPWPGWRVTVAEPVAGRVSPERPDRAIVPRGTPINGVVDLRAGDPALAGRSPTPSRDVLDRLALPGDVNRDGKVDVSDVVTLGQRVQAGTLDPWVGWIEAQRLWEHLFGAQAPMEPSLRELFGPAGHEGGPVLAGAREGETGDLAALAAEDLLISVAVPVPADAPPPPRVDARDVNHDGRVGVVDIVQLADEVHQGVLDPVHAAALAQGIWTLLMGPEEPMPAPLQALVLPTPG